MYKEKTFNPIGKIGKGYKNNSQRRSYKGTVNIHDDSTGNQRNVTNNVGICLLHWKIF